MYLETNPKSDASHTPSYFAAASPPHEATKSQLFSITPPNYSVAPPNLLDDGCISCIVYTCPLIPNCCCQLLPTFIRVGPSIHVPLDSGLLSRLLATPREARKTNDKTITTQTYDFVNHDMLWPCKLYFISQLIRHRLTSEAGNRACQTCSWLVCSVTDSLLLC